MGLDEKIDILIHLDLVLDLISKPGYFFLKKTRYITIPLLLRYVVMWSYISHSPPTAVIVVS